MYLSLCRDYNIKWYYSDNKNRYGFFKGLSPRVCVWVTKETVYIYCEGCNPKLLIILPFSNAMWPDNVPRDDAALLSAQRTPPPLVLWLCHYAFVFIK